MFNFFRIRKISYAISIIFICTGALLIYKQKGLNLGIEFTGGRSYIVAFQQPPQIETIKNKLKIAFKNQSTQVKTYGSTNVLLISTSYLLHKTQEATNQEVKNLLISTIAQETGGVYGEITNNTSNNFIISSTSTIGAAVADDEIHASKIATLLAILIILLYLLLRFRKWQFSLATVIALIHDGLIVIAAFAIARACGVLYEINSNIIGSLLAGLGYSCNNSVVINDRNRSLLKEIGHADLKNVGNTAINQTLGRTIITSFTTLIAIGSLFIFGGEALRGFSFSMIISIIAGTYSSIFIVMPLAYDLTIKKKKT